MNRTLEPTLLLEFLDLVISAAETGKYPALFAARQRLRHSYSNLQRAIERDEGLADHSTRATRLLSTPEIGNEVFAVAIEHSLKVARSNIDAIRKASADDESATQAGKRFIRESLIPFILRIARRAEVSSELIERLERLAEE